MAATDARPVPRKGVAYRHYFSIRNTAGELITSWTGQDSEASLDGAAYADCTNEATEIGTSGTGYIDLTTTEMNVDCLLLKITVTNTDAVLPIFAIYPEEAGDYRVSDSQKVDVNTIKTQSVTCAAAVTIHPAVGSDYKLGVENDGDLTKVNTVDGISAANFGKLEDLLDGTGAVATFSGVEVIASDEYAAAFSIVNLAGDAVSIQGQHGSGIVIESTESDGSHALWIRVATGNPSDAVKLSATTGSAYVPINVAAIWQALTSGLTTVGSIGKKLADWVLGSDNMVKVSADVHTSGQTVKAVTDGVDLIKIGGSTDSLASFKASVDALTVAQVVADVGNTESAFLTDLPVKSVYYYGSSDGGMVLVFVSGTTNAFQSRRVIASITSDTSTLITLEEALDSVPAEGDTFIILGRITELS